MGYLVGWRKEKIRLNQTTKNAKIKCADSIGCCDEDEWKITQPIEFAPIHFVANKKKVKQNRYV